MKFPKSEQIKKKKRINLFPKAKTRSQMIKMMDKIVSLQVRERDNWVCQKCKTQYTPPTNGLQCSHYFSRRYKNTRFDLDNLDSLCASCHFLVESDKQGWYTDYMKDKLGESGLERLRIKAYSNDKLTTDDLRSMLLVEELKGNHE